MATAHPPLIRPGDRFALTPKGRKAIGLDPEACELCGATPDHLTLKADPAGVPHVWCEHCERFANLQPPPCDCATCTGRADL